MEPTRPPAPRPDPTPPVTPAGEQRFASLPGLSASTLATLQHLGYDAMTPIQAASLPPALAGRDLIAQARTGSGKTAAFALAVLARLVPREPVVQALVLCPTRELADQVSIELRRLARADDNVKVLTLCGGAPIRPQLASLAHGAHVVVGTPGRIVDHLQRDSLRLEALQTLVLDEADRMLEMGFADDLAEVAKRTPAQRQTLLFSATYPPGIETLASTLLRDPVEIRLDTLPSGGRIRQWFIEVDESQRLHAVSQVLNHVRPASTLAFCNTKQTCRDLVQVLRAQGFAALELHGDLEQRERDQVMVRFANRSCSVLVATDIAARGIDIAQLEAVINVEIAPDAATHLHRIGRTGRVDADGLALSLVGRDEMGRVGQLEVEHRFSTQWKTLDELTVTDPAPLRPPMTTLHILGGRKEKIRAGDILGALTKDLGFAAADIGKINVNDFSTYVAVRSALADQVVSRLSAGKVKGRRVKVRVLPV